MKSVSRMAHADHPVGAIQTITRTRQEGYQIWNDGALAWMQLQADWIATTFAQDFESTVPLFAPDGANYFVFRLPMLVEKKAVHATRALLDGWVVLARTQQNLLSWGTINCP